MSSPEELAVRHTKKGKLQRACDICRWKKVKCDGIETSGTPCSGCLAQDKKCTYSGSHAKQYTRSYVHKLESRLAHMEKLVAQLRNGEHPLELGTEQGGKDGETSSSKVPRRSTALAVSPSIPDNSEDFEASSDEDDDETEDIIDDLRQLTVDTDVFRNHGKSSGLAFIRSAIDLKKPYTQREDRSNGKRQRDRTERSHALPPTTIGEDAPTKFSDFPPDDLLHSLVELYFLHINHATPVLHEPTFKKALAKGLHRRPGAFSGIVLLVCANAARLTQDPRVYSYGPGGQQPAGWRWFEQVQRARTFAFAQTQLYDLQTYALMTVYIQSSRPPHTIWPFVGIGIRIATDAGVHRRKMYGPTPTVEGELWKRAFWTLVTIEWKAAYYLGRPASIHDEDIDIDLPIDVDDEYWNTPDGKPLFKQPPGIPSKASYFVYTIRLFQILAFATRTICSSTKARAQLRKGDAHWEERVVTELDSALNKWSDSLPAHLRWDPDRQDPLLLLQSATITATFHQVRIAVHRPFVSAARRSTPSSFPSLLICTNAARSAIQIIYTLYKRTGSPDCKNLSTLFIASVVLLIHVMSEKRSGRHTGRSDLDLVGKVIEMHSVIEHELPVSGIFRNLLTDIVAAASEPSEPQVRASASKLTSHAQPNGSAQPWANTTTAPFHPNAASSCQFPGIGTQEWAAQSHGDFSYGTDPTAGLPPLSQSIPLNAVPYNSTYAYTGPPPIASSMSTSFQHVPYPQAPQAQFGTGYTTSMSQLPPSSQYGEPQNPTQAPFGQDSVGYSEHALLWPAVQQPEFSSSNSASPEESYGQDAASMTFDAGDLASMDDAMNMWSSAPPTFGWDDWMAYFSNANGGNYSGSTCA